MASGTSRGSRAAADIRICPFTIAIDQREQAPFSFQGITDGGLPVVVRTFNQHLLTGDYSIDGQQHLIAIERKSKEDLYSTLTHGRERFLREFERLAEMQFAAVVVEASFGSVTSDPPMFSGARPKSIYRSIIALQIRYPRIQWIFCDDRRFAEITTFRVLERFHHVHEEVSL